MELVATSCHIPAMFACEKELISNQQSYIVMIKVYWYSSGGFRRRGLGVGRGDDMTYAEQSRWLIEIDFITLKKL